MWKVRAARDAAWTNALHRLREPWTAIRQSCV